MGTNDFQRKKVGSLTLGERLLALRKEHHVNIHEFVKHTRIQKKYVEALESGNYDQLPSQVYVRGFIHAYENYFGLASGSLTKILDREYQIYENIHVKNDIKEDTFAKKSFASHIVISSRMLLAGLVFCLVAGIGIYAYSGARQFVSAPFIDILAPENGSQTDASSTEIRGMTHPEAFLYLNDDPIAVDVDGSFSQEVILTEGENTFLLRSEGKSGQKTQKKLIIVSTFAPEVIVPKETPEVPSFPVRETVTLTITAGEESVWVRVLSDDVGVFDKTMASGEQQFFEAQEKIVLTAGRGNGLTITHNEQDFGLLSEDEDVVRGVEFGRGYNTLEGLDVSDAVNLEGNDRDTSDDSEPISQ